MGLEGSARMALDASGNNRWTYSLQIQSAVAQLSQSTVFDASGDAWRPLSGHDMSSVLIKKSDKQATYDWSHNQATWSGDIKEDRRGPVALRAGDVDAMLLNLALPRDVAAGRSLRYRMPVDDFDYAASGRRVLAIEVQGLEAIAARIDGAFSAACRLLLGCRGRVVCTGMLKAGGVLVARRTVAKYREALRIPSSHDRVRLG